MPVSSSLLDEFLGGSGSFLTDQSSVAEEFTAQPRPAARGQAVAGRTFDFSYDVDPGQRAVVAVRHPSGALTFHAPTEVRRPRGSAGQVHFSVTLPAGSRDRQTRGFVGTAIKAVIIKVAEAAVDKVASLALPALARAFETAAWRKRGLHEGWLTVTREALAAGRLEAGRPRSLERSLVFIHGTFSNTASAFKRLADTDFFERVRPMYGDRIFAFDHFSVSRTPEENARALLQALPDGPITFDAVTHSRGGLVLRTLVEQRAAFGSLAGRFRLGRAVFVASPNEGTPLATPRRWDETVGWLANLLELFPDNPFTTGAEFVANGLLWLARRASGDLPGLHAMDGDGPLIAALQSPAGAPADAYSALVSNYQPDERVLARLLDTGVDQFFGSANDLVMPSEGGWRIDRAAARSIPGSRIGCFGPGGNLARDSVTHVGFFSLPETTTFLVTALAGQAHRLPAIDPLRNLPDRRLLRAKALPAAATPPRLHAGPRVVTSAPAIDRHKPTPITMTVMNGDLTFERRPLLIGHYHSTKLSGAEWVIDQRIGGAMQRSLDLGTYPMATGTSGIFINRRASLWRVPRPQAVVVVGLGQEGELQAARLSFSVRQAVLAWVQRVVEAGQDSRSCELAATLIGSGGTGISAGQAAQLVAQGVYEANKILAAEGEGGDPAWPLVAHVSLIELYLDRATEAWHAVKLLADTTPERYTLVDTVVVGTGGLPRPLEFGYRGADYDFITAETREERNGESSIAYALDTKRARTEVRAQTTQGRLVRDLVAAASADQYLDETIGQTLFKLLVPIDLEPYFSGGNPLQIELDAGTAGIPWELLDDTSVDQGQGARPWAIRTRLLRKIRTPTYRHSPTDADADAHALVIGEPLCPPEYPSLPGARLEAERVFTCLAGDHALTARRVSRLFSPPNDPHPGPDARTVMNTFLERPWRIIHIAGHGELPTDDGKPGGVVLSDGSLLGPSEIAALRTVPELVFVNCCHLAAFDNERVLQPDGGAGPKTADRVRLAAGVAEKLIEIGVRCVVAAGWAVDDEAAAVFATTFYAALLDKRRFIDAVADAREKTYALAGNTWAAYQCYGDPDWRLFRDGERPQATQRALEDEFRFVVSSHEARLAVDTLLVQTTYQDRDQALQRERLGHLEKRCEACGWADERGMAERFAQAFGAAGGIDEAIRWYERALGRSDGDVSPHTIEQHSNLVARRAWVRVAQVHGDSADAHLARATTVEQGRRDIAQAIQTLSSLIDEHRTAERLSLRGSAMKRLAMVEAVAGDAEAERKAVEAMRRDYLAACELEAAAGACYAALNVVAAELVLADRDGAGVDGALLVDTRKRLEAKNADDPDFWSLVGELEASLYDAVHRRDVASVQAALVGSFRDLHKRSRRATEWSSVLDTALFVLQRYGARTTPAEQAAARAVVGELEALAGRTSHAGAAHEDGRPARRRPTHRPNPSPSRVLASGRGVSQPTRPSSATPSKGRRTRRS